MASEGSTKAVITAMFANLGIAVTKFIAAALTGSSSMLAEGVHSLADTSNQALLLLGSKRAKRAATTEHPWRTSIELVNANAGQAYPCVSQHRFKFESRWKSSVRI